MKDSAKITLADDTRQLCLGHLQLPDNILSSLHGQGLVTIGNAADIISLLGSSGLKYGFELRFRLLNLSRCNSSGRTDWNSFLKLLSGRLCQLCITTPQLDSISGDSLLIPVNKQTFGNAGAMLAKAGYSNLGELRDGLRQGIAAVPGLGKRKLEELLQRMLDISKAIDEGDFEKFSPTTLSDCFQPLQTKDIRGLLIGVLHLGIKAQWFRKAGITTVGDMLDAWPIRLGSIGNIGNAIIERTHKRLTALVGAANSHGRIDWEKYTAEIGLPLVPSDSGTVLAGRFLSSLPEALEQIASNLPDEHFAEILKSRLAKPPAERKTLEEIAQSGSKKITRERVRQKEAKLLEQLANALIWDIYGSLGIHFKPVFSNWWKLAAARFQGVEEIEFDEFITGLGDVWGADTPSIIEQLPIILAIVTGDPNMPSGFRSAIRIDPVLYGRLPEETLALRLDKLRIGRGARQLAEKGVSTVGDFIEMCRSGDSMILDSAGGKSALVQLTALASSLTREGAVNWRQYLVDQELVSIPPQATSSPKQFSMQLTNVIETVLKTSCTYSRAPEIHRLRTSRTNAKRKTLQALADGWGVPGPSVSRDETFLKKFIFNLVIERDFSRSPFWFQKDWLRYWSDAARVFDSGSTNYSEFCQRLSNDWLTDASDLQGAFPTLWAVLSCGRGRLKDTNKTESIRVRLLEGQPARIRLRGFRRVH